MCDVESFSSSRAQRFPEHPSSAAVISCVCCVSVTLLTPGCRTAAPPPAMVSRLSTTPVVSAPAVVPQQSPKPEPRKPPVTVVQQQFVASMTVVKTNMGKLGQDDWSPATYIDSVLTDSRRQRQEAFDRVLGLLTRRIKLEAETLKGLDRAARLYEQLRASTAEYNAELQQLAEMAEADLDDLTEDLNGQVDALSKVMDGAELDLFQDFGQEKVKLIAGLKEQQLATVPDQSDYFERLRALVRTSMVADRYQLINLQYVAKAMDMSDGLQKVHDVMVEVSVADYVSDLGDAEVDAANMVSVLNHSFASAWSSVIPAVQILPTRPTPRHSVAITPSRGLGGAYYVGETVHFTITATRDCDFILLHTDSSGKVQQLCPNRYSMRENHLKANVPLTIPGTALPYEFVASEPVGVETITLICMGSYRYNPAIDLVKVDPAALRPRRSKTAPYLAMRGIDIQPKTETLSCGVAYDSGVFSDSGSGNAVRVETFIRVRRR